MALRREELMRDAHKERVKERVGKQKAKKEQDEEKKNRR